MLSFLPSYILMPITFALFCSNLALCGSFVFIGGLVKLLIPIKSFHLLMSYPMDFFYRTWALNNFLIMTSFNKIDWKIKGEVGLNKDSWYLLIANHQSWLDIFVLSYFARSRIPSPKYFLKDSLKKVPFVGMACWALDMPFMKRYSRSFLDKNPHLKGKNIETTKQSCEKFKYMPTTIINFVEGTRFTKEKHEKQNNEFKNLLIPKAGGIAFALQTMGEQFDQVLNITIVYPNTKGHIMKEMLKGRLTHIVIDIEQISNDELPQGNYSQDIEYKINFHRWLTQLWHNNDKKISQYLMK